MLLTHLVHCPRHKHGNEVQQLMAPNQLEQCHCSLSLLPQQRATHNQHMNSGGHLPKCICGPGVGTGGLPRQSFNGALPGNSLGRAGMCQMQTETASGGRGSGSAPRAWGGGVRTPMVQGRNRGRKPLGNRNARERACGPGSGSQPHNSQVQTFILCFLHNFATACLLNSC